MYTSRKRRELKAKTPYVPNSTKFSSKWIIDLLHIIAKFVKLYHLLVVKLSHEAEKKEVVN